MERCFAESLYRLGECRSGRGCGCAVGLVMVGVLDVCSDVVGVMLGVSVGLLCSVMEEREIASCTSVSGREISSEVVLSLHSFTPLQT